MSKPSKGIQSIEVGGQLLLALGAHGAPMMLRDLAQAAGMPAAKAHPYLVSFGHIGLVEQDPVTGWYRLGALALRLGLASLQQSEPVRIATAALADLGQRVQQTVTLSVWSGRGPTIVRIDEADRPLQANLRIGTLMSTVTTATGRVFAAFLPAEQTAAVIRQERARLAGMHGSVRTAIEQFDSQVADIRRRGIERGLGSPLPGIDAFSVPVLDRSGAAVVAVTATGPSGGFDSAWDGPVAAALLELSGRLSARLGHVAPGRADVRPGGAARPRQQA